MADYFKRIAVDLAAGQKDYVDAITQASPELATLPMSPTTHGDWDMSPVVKNITGGSFVEFNQALPTMSVNSDIEKVSLKILGGNIFCPQDTARQYAGGKEEYFARMSMPLVRASAQTVGADILTNSFRQYAIDNGNIIKQATSGSGSIFSSIIAVTYTDNEVEGLYNPNFWNGNGIFTFENLYNGALMEESSISGFKQQMKTVMGIKLLNENKVSAYVNINASNLPTATKMDQLLEQCEAGTGMKTILYMPPRVYTYLKNLKNSAITDFAGDTDVFKGFTAWDTTTIVPTYNMPKLTETLVS